MLNHERMELRHPACSLTTVCILLQPQPFCTAVLLRLTPVLKPCNQVLLAKRCNQVLLAAQQR